MVSRNSVNIRGGYNMGSTVKSDAECFSVDVVIIGSGGGGLPAAVAAAEAGAKKIAILERRKFLGGTARMAGGLFAVESPAQKRLGIHHTADELFKMHMEYANWMCDAKLVRNWMNGSGDVIRWLEGKGLEFTVESAPIGSIQPRTGHQLLGRPLQTGNAIMKVMIEDCKKAGVQLITETRAHKLLTDGKGNVTGVLGIQKDKEVKVTAKSVIIAAGPITGNKEMMKKLYPRVNFENVSSGLPLPDSTGDGLLMAEEIGAATTNKEGLTSCYFVGPGDHSINMSVNNLVRRPHMVWVNKYGERFADETLWSLHTFQQWLAGFALDRQPGRMCYALMDDKILRDMIEKRENVYNMERLAAEMAEKSAGKKDYLNGWGIDAGTGPNLREGSDTHWLSKLEDAIQSEVKREKVKIADSWDDIAEWMGAEPAVLKATINQYNAFCINRHDADFLKPKEWLLPLTTPPYYAIICGQFMDPISLGGIRISHRMEVLDKELLKPIGGLYAAGTGTSGWLGPGFSFGAAALSFSIFSGYAAGNNAAAYSKSHG
jgi:fumarate reductase flavoprotein subunit